MTPFQNFRALTRRFGAMIMAACPGRQRFVRLFRPAK